MIQRNYDKLNAQTYSDAEQMGVAAALFTAQTIQGAIEKKGQATIILATGTSQFTFLEALKKETIDWSRVVVFHLDEYIGIPGTHPASFRRYLKERVIDIVQPKAMYFLSGSEEDVEQTIHHYSTLLNDHSIDLACIGIGENGHIAFNDPPVADFDDPHLVKVVELDDACRQQQFGEGWFPTLNDVPRTALTLTIPAIMGAEVISCVVPESRKAKAVHQTLLGPISTACPASILRTHPSATLFLDEEAAHLLP